MVLLMAMFDNSFAQQSSKSTQKTDEKEIKLGKTYYAKYSCHSCHGEDGKSQGDLTQAYKKYTDDVIVNYIKRPDTYNNLKMPVYSGVILDSEYYALVKYIRYLGEKAN